MLQYLRQIALLEEGSLPQTTNLGINTFAKIWKQCEIGSSVRKKLKAERIRLILHQSFKAGRQRSIGSQATTLRRLPQICRKAEV